jgi:hypothetical protein
MSGSMAVGENSSLLRLQGMPKLTDGEVYQVWVSQDDRVQPSSNFIPDASGQATTGVDGHLGNGAEVMITKESGPGHKTPTPPILLRATVD